MVLVMWSTSLQVTYFWMRESLVQFLIRRAVAVRERERER